MSVDNLCLMTKTEEGWVPVGPVRKCSYCGWINTTGMAGSIQSDPDDRTSGIWFCSTDHWLCAKRHFDKQPPAAQPKLEHPLPTVATMKRLLMAREDWEELCERHPGLATAVQEYRKKASGALISAVWLECGM